MGSSPTPGTIYKNNLSKTFNKKEKEALAYIVGISLGDGNLSNPNGRAVRLRITCDKKYPKLINRIIKNIKLILPNNKISKQERPGRCLDVSCYSNKWEKLLGWNANKGSKYNQNIFVPLWIFKDKKYIKACLKGLIESDGSVYNDRGYKMVNFVTTIPNLSKDFNKLMNKLGFYPKTYKINIKKRNHKDRFNIRLSKNVNNFLTVVKINKS